ncbi:hypothetical protein R1sor_022074 [Riccia sorocarpa]|uniref:Protein PAM68, chloroplastic n=1 Tax=Riccia sorocarpa TaxID=122646 RepID=A0ABD3GJJ0_9MARC
MALSVTILSWPSVCPTSRGSTSKLSSQRSGKMSAGAASDCSGWRLLSIRSMAPEDHKMTRRSPFDVPLGTEFSLEMSRSQSRSLQICFALQPDKKGFGKPPARKKALDKRPDSLAGELPDSGTGRGPAEEEADDDVVPEVVTNRMLKRISLTVGAPLAVGVLFFPLYYYLKVVKKVDVPEWLPLLTSMLTFGIAGLGISYGVLSASWDPAREGSLLGWREAQLNWPVFLETVQGKKEKK